MALPKSVLCLLGENDYGAEARLRSAGFATASLSWKELNSQPNLWMQLADVLQDEAVQNIVFAGENSEFNEGILAQLSLLRFSLKREKEPIFAFTGPTAQELKLPVLLSDSLLFKQGMPLGAKLMAKRFQSAPIRPALPFYLQAHLDSLVGLWLEIAPKYGEWPGFMLAVTDAQINSFGVGPRGLIPQKTTLSYPMLGIKGDIGGKDFSACAAQNTLDSNTACYCRLDGIPSGLFIADYPNDDAGMEPRFPFLPLG